MKNYRSGKSIGTRPAYRTPSQFRNMKIKHTERQKSGKGKKK